MTLISYFLDFWIFWYFGVLICVLTRESRLMGLVESRQFEESCRYMDDTSSAHHLLISLLAQAGNRHYWMEEHVWCESSSNIHLSYIDPHSNHIIHPVFSPHICLFIWILKIDSNQSFSHFWSSSMPEEFNHSKNSPIQGMLTVGYNWSFGHFLANQSATWLDALPKI